MDRVFLDANILFSVAYGSPGLSRLWQWAADGRILLLTSTYAAVEARRNLDLRERLAALAERLAALTVVAEGPAGTPCPLSLPDKDRPIWSAAVSAGSTHLLTGDARHFGKHFDRTVQGILILRPADYLAKGSP